MPGNDLTAVRALVPSGSTQRNTAELNVSSVLTSILDDIEPAVTPAGLDMSSDLSFLSGGTRQAIIDLGYLGLEDRDSDTTQVASLYVKDDELWFHDGAGVKFAMTSGGAVTGAAGNINGAGYGSGGVEVLWDAGTTAYRMRSSGAAHPDGYADIVVDSVQFSDSVNIATLAPDPTMSGAVNMTLPPNIPGSTSLMTISSAGAMNHTRDPSVDSLTLSGDLTVTGTIKHSADTLVLGAHNSVGGSGSYSATTGSFTTTTNGGDYDIPLDLPAGSRVTDVVIYVFGGSTGTKELHFCSKAGAANPIELDTQTNTTSGETTITLSSINRTLSSAINYFVRFHSGSTSDEIHHVRVTYDRP
jgi:hypothetical protein